MRRRLNTLPTPDFPSRDFVKDCSDSLLLAALRQSHRRSLETARDFAEQGVTGTTAYRVRIAGSAMCPGSGSQVDLPNGARLQGVRIRVQRGVRFETGPPLRNRNGVPSDQTVLDSSRSASCSLIEVQYGLTAEFPQVVQAVKMTCQRID